MTDAELMARVKSGEPEAFRCLVDRHKHKLVNYLTAMSRDRGRAEELAQEAFVRLYEFAGRYQERGEFRPYLYRIATNLLRDEERTRRRREMLLHAFSWNGHRNGASHAPGPDAALLSREIGEQVERAMAELPLHFRSPLLLRDLEGWSYDAIAAALGCREGTVKSRISRGRAELRRRLEPYWNGGR